MICYNGIKFYPDGNKKYYYSSKIRKQLHQYIYECEVKPIPIEYEIHHKDLNRENNSIDNLICLTRSEHHKIHSELLTEEQRYKRKENLKLKAQPKAIEWHKSAKGREWHKKHAKNVIENLKEKEYTCKHCGKEFVHLPLGTNKFCSNKCKSAWRRKSGIDNINKKCIICGEEFISNKYDKVYTCSSSCANKLAWEKRKHIQDREIDV